MNIYNYLNYKKYILDNLKNRPKKGYGESAKIAQAIGVNSTMVSQILRGKAHINQDQALGVAKYFGLNSIETEYFVLLVLYGRAGTLESSNYFKNKLSELKIKMTQVKEVMNLNSEISETQRTTFYSQWYYSAIWLITAIEKFQTKEEISKHLNIPIQRISDVLLFLTQIGLVSEANGRYQLIDRKVHISSESPLVIRHHHNWRLVAMNSIEKDPAHETSLFFTGPMVISKNGAKEIRELLLKQLKDVQKISGPSECEELYCLNIDWFKFKT